MVFDTTDWQGAATIGPTAAPAFQAYQLNIGATQVIIPAAAGLSVVLYGFTLQVNDTTGTLIAIEDSNLIPLIEYKTGAQLFHAVQLFGLKLGLGLGVTMRNVGAANMVQADLITLIYAQG